MKPLIYVDTDIVLDMLAKRDPFYAAAATLFSKAEKGNVTLCVSSLTFSNLFYILKKQLSARTAHEVLRAFRQLVTVVAVDDTIVEQALESRFTDFEDALQYFAALSVGCTVLITRNVRHYRKAAIRVVTAEVYCSTAG